MKDQKLLSIVIPAYNVEQFLEECIESLLYVKLVNSTEILIIDDGSKDNTSAIADRYAKQYPKIIKVIHKQNGGHGSAINTGIAAAQGIYFKVVDGDDTVNPTAYDRYLKELQKIEIQGCDLVATPFTCMIYKTGKLKKVIKRQIQGTEKIPQKKILSFQDTAKFLHIRMHEWTIRTAILKEQKIVLSEHSFYVDMQYILFPIPWIKTICILPYFVYQYRLGEEQQSVSIKNMQKNREQHKNIMRSLIHFYRLRKAKGDSEIVLFYLARGIAKMETNQVQIALSLPIGKQAKKELIGCEKEIKKNCPMAYWANEKRSIKLLRNSNYMMYPIASIVWKMINR